MNTELQNSPTTETPVGMSGKLQSEALHLVGKARKVQESLDSANADYDAARAPARYREGRRSVPGSEKAMAIHGTAVVRAVAQVRSRFSNASERATDHYRANEEAYHEQALIDDAQKDGVDIVDLYAKDKN